MLLDFVVHLVKHGHTSVGTIKQFLSSIRAQQGLSDSRRSMPRLWMAMDGLRRKQGGPRRKRSVTPRVLRWIKKSLRPTRSHADAALWLGIVLAYFFLLRASEYLTDNQKGMNLGTWSRLGPQVE